ncbi:MAG TPA: hypothetical protein PLK37_13370 [Terricaulis sp.]|nr:hypothetical protein [Terricaulis sp.]
MGESIALADWRVRVLARAGAFVLCAAFCALLVLASRVTLSPEGTAGGVEVFLERPPERELARPAQPRPSQAGAPIPSPAPATAPSADAAMQAQLLRCFVRPGQPRPPGCPSEPPPEDWRRPQLPVGGDYAPPPEPDMNAIYTRAERDTLVMPSCIRDKTSGACMRFGQRPPPPSRSAEQICRDGGLGGPCRPPAEQEE